MNALLEARRRARERLVECGGFSYTIRRPLAAEIAQPMTKLESVRRFTVGWNVKEADLVPGGDPEPAAFSPELFADWIADRPEDWATLSSAIEAMWDEHQARKAGAEKN